MLKVRFTAQFKREYKLCIKRGLNPEKFNNIVTKIRNGEVLPEKNRDHALVNSKNFIDARECHIEPYWLLVYRIHKNILVLELLRTGTHSDLY